MKINLDKNLVEFTPETADEKAKLEALWKLVVDCVRFNKKLVPVGEYVPAKNNMARFVIEGEPGGKTDEYAAVYADSDARAYCQTCNKFVELKKGDRVPPCCGKIMEILD
jgi:hypothetical protein